MLTENDITLYIGGTRSGKSILAEKDAQEDSSRSIIYVATSIVKPDDISMKERIDIHKKRRPESWTVLEIHSSLGEYLERYFSTIQKNTNLTILIDCITMLITNLMFSIKNPLDSAQLNTIVEKEILELCSVMQKYTSFRWILVSGETGLGGISANEYTRVFTDALGLANQQISCIAKNVFLVVAGRKLRLE